MPNGAALPGHGTKADVLDFEVRLQSLDSPSTQHSQDGDTWPARDAGAIWQVLEAEREGPTAICVHGDALRALLDDLIERGITRRVKQASKKGATWVLEVRDGAIVSARHVPAPPAT